MPDWADEKALALCALEAVSPGWHRHAKSCGHCRPIAAALREAREQGAREERRACHEIAATHTQQVAGIVTVARIIADAIVARGPMSEESQEGECPCNPIDGKCVYCGRPEGGGE